MTRSFFELTVAVAQTIGPVSRFASLKGQTRLGLVRL
jgi:hypothetical protein